MANVTVRDLAEALHLKVISGEAFLNREITTTNISRPGLELTGYFNYYASERVQLFGLNEHSYMKKMTSAERLLMTRRMARPETPCFIFSRGLEPEYEVIQALNENQIPILGSDAVTTQLFKNITSYLQETLSPRQSVHGVFVDVYGLGILIIGDSGIGKSETALELIKHGHRLVADDRVELHKRDERTIIGEAPEILQNMIEIRGLGIMNVLTLFGAGAVRRAQELNMIINLLEWDQGENYDRLGTAPEMVSYFGIDIPKITVPIRTGRNSSNIVEVAAMNFRARSMGFDSEEQFEQRLTELIQRNSQFEKTVTETKRSPRPTVPKDSKYYLPREE
ncbi:MAG: HPr(Ser) kinase/phosphatase [Aerococcus sp.]|nr:HPr(Ser) kinase/phosphatase [Aerococcus sp.]